jgi:hypothetical protein
MAPYLMPHKRHDLADYIVDIEGRTLRIGA